MKNIVMGVMMTAAALAGAVSPTQAQGAGGRISLELSGDAAVPAQMFGAEYGANTGASVGAGVVYAFTPGLRGYLGYDRGYFPCDNSRCGSGGYLSTGVSAGAELALARTVRSVSPYPWARVGVLLNRLEHEVHDGSTTIGVRSDVGVGIQVSAGIAVPLTSRLTLRPGVGYSRYSADFQGSESALASEIDVQAVAVGVALRVRL